MASPSSRPLPIIRGLGLLPAGEDSVQSHVVARRVSLSRVAYRIVDPVTIDAGPGPHPAASAFDKRVSEALGISAFEVYTVDLPPDAETVRHDHLDDGVEDLCFVVSGDGWVLVDGEELPVRPGLFVAVSKESVRQLRAGNSGLALVAVCGAPR